MSESDDPPHTPRKVTFSPARGASPTVKSPTPSKNKPTTTRKIDKTPTMTTVTATMDESIEYTVIDVDVEHPEKNREFLVIDTTRMPGVDKKSFYDGYIIMLQQFDLVRWLYENEMMEFLESRVVEPNKLLVKAPSLPYSLIHDRAQTNKQGTDRKSVV